MRQESTAAFMASGKLNPLFFRSAFLVKSKIIIEKVFDDFYLLRVDDEEMEYFEAAKFSIVDVMGFKGRSDGEAGKNISRSV